MPPDDKSYEQTYWENMGGIGPHPWTHNELKAPPKGKRLNDVTPEEWDKAYENTKQSRLHVFEPKDTDAGRKAPDSRGLQD